MTTFLRKKFVMSLFRIIFAIENGQEEASLGFALGSLCLRSGFALPSLLKVEEKRIQNGSKKPHSSPLRLSDEIFFVN